MREIKQQQNIPNLILIEFLNSIKEGEIKVGEILDSERSLAKQLNVSRSSLREAFSILEFLGVISNDGNKKIITKDYNSIKPLLILINNNSIENKKNIIYDYIEFRKFLELKNLELACENRDESELIYLWEIYNKMLTENINYTELDYELHMCIAKATHNIFLISMIELMISFIDKYRCHLIEYPGRLESIRNEYFEIISGIETRDYERAKKAMEDHLFFIEATLKAFDEFKEIEL